MAPSAEFGALVPAIGLVIELGDRCDRMPPVTIIAHGRLVVAPLHGTPVGALPVIDVLLFVARAAGVGDTGIQLLR